MSLLLIALLYSNVPSLMAPEAEPEKEVPTHWETPTTILTLLIKHYHATPAGHLSQGRCRPKLLALPLWTLAALACKPVCSHLALFNNPDSHKPSYKLQPFVRSTSHLLWLTNAAASKLPLKARVDRLRTGIQGRFMLQEAKVRMGSGVAEGGTCWGFPRRAHGPRWPGTL